jgi:NADH-ubiquinone oxidoreductase complex I, 21 kDa subunit
MKKKSVGLTLTFFFVVGYSGPILLSFFLLSAADCCTAPFLFFSGIYTLQPKYPIVKPDPSVDDVIKGMRMSDYFFISSVMVGTYAYGFILGKPVRGPTAVMCASAGFTFGMFHTMQTVRSRFLGYRENSREVTRYGLATVQPRPYKSVIDKRFPTRQDLITKPPLDWDNY